MDKTVLLIMGPTASGKTEAALRLAQLFHSPIISADSRQCYKELNLGVAKPSMDQLNLVQHYFINSHSIKQEVNASNFEQLALQWADEIFKNQDIFIMVGGTGLYLKAFCEGLDDIPPIDQSIRSAIRQNYTQYGLEWLQLEVKIKDPEFFSKGESMNPRRLMRALEVVVSTDRSILSFRTKIGKKRPFRIIKAGLELTLEELYRNINNRTDKMIESGLLEEVRKLSAFRHLNALQTVGYSEFFRYLDGEISFGEAIERIKKNTRNYAKRQLTWFRKDKSIQWIRPDDWEQLKKITQS